MGQEIINDSILERKGKGVVAIACMFALNGIRLAILTENISTYFKETA